MQGECDQVVNDAHITQVTRYSVRRKVSWVAAAALAKWWVFQLHIHPHECAG